MDPARVDALKGPGFTKPQLLQVLATFDPTLIGTHFNDTKELIAQKVEELERGDPAGRKAEGILSGGATPVAPTPTTTTTPAPAHVTPPASPTVTTPTPAPAAPAHTTPVHTGGGAPTAPTATPVATPTKEGVIEQVKRPVKWFLKNM